MIDKKDIKKSCSLNQICDEMITIEGGLKSGEMFIITNANKQMIAIEGDPSSGIIWSATQKGNKHG